MSLFNPEKMIKNMLAGLGVNPEDFVGFIQMARTESLEMGADRLAFKPASIKAYQDIMARLDHIEAQQAAIAERLMWLCTKPIAEFTPNERLNGHEPPGAGSV